MSKLVVIVLLLFVLTSSTQEKQNLSPIIFIYDASGSMWGQIGGKSKMEIASTVLSDVVNNLHEEQLLGLVAYGHRREGDCEDVEFLVDVQNNTKNAINESLKKIKPLGKTPLAHSALLVIDKLRQSGLKATIILVTDGIESCGGNICDVIKAAREEGIDFKLHIVGFGLKKDETDQLKCAAKAGGGKYYDAGDAGGLGEVLTEATTETVDKPAGNFSVYAIKNNEAIDAMVYAYQAGTTKEASGVRTYRDTGYLYLPAGKYDLKVTPLENSKVKPVTISNIESFDDRTAHQTIIFDGGKIQVSTFNNGEGWDAMVKVVSKSDGTVAASGRTYGKPKALEVNPGVYDVEIQALVIEGTGIIKNIKSFEVSGGDTNEISHNFKSGIAMIGAKNASGLVDATVNFYEISSNKNVAAARTYASESNNPKKFILTPGSYRVVLMSLGKEGGKKESFIIDVKENKTIEKTITF